MSTLASKSSTVIRTERGLTIAGTRITLYAVMDYVTAGCPPELIRERLQLTDQQVNDVLAYIQLHQAEVDQEYKIVLQRAAENRRYWEERNRERFAEIAANPQPGHEVLRAKLAAWKAGRSQV